MGNNEVTTSKNKNKKKTTWYNAKPQEETLRHLEVFEIYYAMGDARSIKVLADVVGIGYRTLEMWSAHFKWQDRIGERDKELITRIKHDFQDEILRYRSFYIDLVKGMIKQCIIVNNETGETTCSIKPNNVNDLEKLIKLHMSLMGDNGAPPPSGGGSGGNGNMTVQIVVPQQLEMGKWSDMVKGATPTPLTFPVDNRMAIEDAITK
jgi:hypothetical protein